jgi:hypothetical protein
VLVAFGNSLVAFGRITGILKYYKVAVLKNNFKYLRKYKVKNVNTIAVLQKALL